jgi:hypothetical protein
MTGALNAVWMDVVLWSELCTICMPPPNNALHRTAADAILSSRR